MNDKQRLQQALTEAEKASDEIEQMDSRKLTTTLAAVLLILTRVFLRASLEGK